MGFPFLTIFIIFILWLAYRRYLVTKAQQKETDDFWARERAANATLSKDISNLSYITIPLDKFPLQFSDNPEVIALEKRLSELSECKLLNLTGKTNTELKEAYGVLNFETMSKIGDDFDELTIVLNKYAKAIIEEKDLLEAIPVLEFAVGIGTDIKESYIMLADAYQAADNTSKLSYLRTQVEHSNLVLKDSVLNHIEGLIKNN